LPKPDFEVQSIASTSKSKMTRRNSPVTAWLAGARI
jgi:hypothetical protein